MPFGFDETLAIAKCNLDLSVGSGSSSSDRALQSIAASNIVIAESLMKISEKLNDIDNKLLMISYR